MIPEGAAGSALVRSKRLLVAVVIGALAMVGVGFALSTVIKSPAQAAADAGAPEPDVLTAVVEHRELRASLVVRGQVAAERSVMVSAAAGSAAEGSSPLITKAPLRGGDKVTSGQVLIEISGRPVFALPGALPAYRDLKPGADGADVAQLQKALTQLGFSSGTDGRDEFGAGTQSALSAFYQSIGYDARPVTDDGESQVQAAEAAVTDATRALQDIRSGKGEGTAVARAEEDLALAEEHLADARLQAGAMLPAAEVVFLDHFPARVETVAAGVGDRAPGSVMTLSSGALGVRGTLTPSQRKMVRPGQKVDILAEATGDEFSGTTVSVGDGTRDPVGEQDLSAAEKGEESTGEGTGGDTADGFSVLAVKTDERIDASLVGQEVRLTIEIKSSEDKVLVVPFSAVSAAADGSTVVTVLADDGERRRVRVRPGLEGDGSVQVTPVGKDGLAEGDRLIVGTDSDGPSGQDAAE
ncbi:MULTISPECIES: peptidoglycan-binding protein [unclassified Streptomyces]|uniref:peptidoglycan-binding protein n=1 Tax=unclassified Streptomyces TaxID=2593676 RepID=UPI0021566AAC|nr:peptidoglycan-binding protein [Streptomyces sp. SM10]